MFSFSILLTIYIGFTHAFEADHLLAVSNIVTQRSSITQSIKDGAVWGFGHATAIVLIGAIALLLKVHISPSYFNYFEALVGIMLIALGAYRLVKLKRLNVANANFFHTQHHQKVNNNTIEKSIHLISYSVGLMHGIAGSGELVLLTMLQIKNAQAGMLYLLVFAIGSIAGMMVAAAMCSIPFYKKMVAAKNVQTALILLSAILCIVYGVYVLYKNIQ
jgi:high-affinity nickel permease